MLTMSTVPSGFLTSQVQPDPKLPTAVACNFTLKSANEPNAFLMAAARAPVGSPPPLGPMPVK